ncbi:N-acetylmuramoyl-L-alanine amidase [Mangrovimonas sp. YM274]|uniref:N-acetylmuramoyl-L-alanine amidase n=1 Tax=Mangrovimonas sp. YM274 TaxID=3070660 RepID=UPI0027DC7CED|nr:N-acetylmuramoyl-L-alanine amidase [Mangrovimonas sp. YM274]WMI67390.1 N-acetylmuramoyl-L-alanine amidase [Mangrovimonas sp. YM274]
MRTYLLSIIVLFTISLTFAASPRKDRDKFVVVLDAGHGGHDPGNLGNGYKEKDIALKIVLDLGATLEKLPNVKVIYTRKTDVFVELRERAAIANRADADLFVSVHCNAHGSSAHGTETFVLGVANDQRNFEIAKKENEVIFLESNHEKHYEGFDPNSPESMIGISIMQEEYTENSIRLARMIEDNFSHILKRKSRGIKQASLWVLHNTYMPSVLIEVGFLTYKPEGQYLNSGRGQGEMANSIKNAVISYKKFLEQNVGENIFSDDDLAMVGESELETKVELPEVYKDITFKVQIAASSKRLKLKAYNFNGLEVSSVEQAGNVYKYFYGETSDYNEIQKFQEVAKQKGYSGSFIVAYKNGVRIDLSEALKTATN